jgi:hypothetical protein
MNQSIDKTIKPILIIIILVNVTPLLEINVKLLASYFFMLVLILNNKFNLKQGLKLLMIIALFLLISLVNNYLHASSIGFSMYDLYFCSIVFYGYLLARFYAEDVFYHNLKITIINSLIIGLPIFLLTLIYPSLLDIGINYSIGDTDIHKSLIFLNFHYLDGVFTERFVGLGPEPGYTQIFLNIVLYVILKTEKKIGWKTVIIIISILLTKSTAGIICMIAIITFSIYSLLTRYKIFLLIGLILIWPELNYHIDNKLFGSDSFDGRFSRYVYTYNTYDSWEILFGKGSDFYNIYLKLNDLGGFDSFLQMIQRYGLISLLIILFLLITSNAWAIVLILLVGIFSQSIILSPFFWFFIFKTKNNLNIDGKINNSFQNIN